MKVSLVLETAEARELHHLAVLIGYGAEAINPYLAIYTIKIVKNKDKEEGSKCLKGLWKGNLKNHVKNGHFYSKCIAVLKFLMLRVFGAINDYFPGTASLIGGIGVRKLGMRL